MFVEMKDSLTLSYLAVVQELKLFLCFTGVIKSIKATEKS